MRVTDSQFSTLMQTSMQSSRAEINTLFEQAATSKKLNHLSDDPIASVKLQGLSQNKATSEQYISNIDNVISGFSLYETLLNTAVDITQNINDLILRGKNGDLDDESRAGIVTELEAHKEELLTIFNHQDQGRYIFSGTDIYQQTIDETTYQVMGNAEHRNTAIGEGDYIANNITLDQVVSAQAYMLALDDVIAEFSSPTPDMTQVDVSLQANTDAMDSILLQLTSIGGEINSLERSKDTNTDLVLFAQTLSDELSVADYAEVSVKLNESLAVLEATQKVFLQINSYSLFKLM